MPTAMEKKSPSSQPLDLKQVLGDLEVPFPPELVQWRVTNTSNDKKRGQVVAYADPRAIRIVSTSCFRPRAGHAITVSKP